MGRLVAWCAVIALSWSGLAGAQAFSSLEERMSEQEFRDAGLDRLSAEELAKLNAWIKIRVGSVGTPGAPSSNDRIGFRPSSGLLADSGDRSVGTRIDGPFSGWSPGDTFTLQNGQQWKVTDDSSLSIPTLQSPTVSIEPGMLGSWMFKVEGYNRVARVTRIR